MILMDDNFASIVNGEMGEHAPEGPTCAGTEGCCPHVGNGIASQQRPPSGRVHPLIRPRCRH